MSVQTSLRDGLVDISARAAHAILQVYAHDFDVQHKGDDSPVTAADLAAHHVIVDALAQLTPDIPVLSEESAHLISVDARRQWPRLWLVDPLDGTREFVKRNGEFSVNIALIEHGVATQGIIQQPTSGDVWWAAQGQGAWRLRDADWTRLHCRTPAPAPLRIAASRSHRDARTEALLAQVPEAEVIQQGSSLKFCRMAEGDIDLYPRFGPTSEWDTAAGQVIVEQAGGVLLDLQQRPFRYNQRDTLLNGEFIAAGDADLLAHPAVAEHLAL